MSDHPVFAILGALAAVATILTFVFMFVLDGDGATNGLGGGDSGGQGADGGGVSIPDLENFGGLCDDPQLSLSDGSGSSGTQVVVSGSGFPGQEEVDLRFHTERLTPALTDEEGAFQETVRIPGSFDPFAPRRFDIVAQAGPCSDSVVFELQR